MDWVILFQNQYNRIIFVSSQNPEERDSMAYDKFLSFINQEFKIKNFPEFHDKIDRFKVIYLIKDGTWEIMEDTFIDASFQELYAINGFTQEENTKTATEERVESSKKWLDKIFDIRKKETSYDSKFTDTNRRKR
jgi:hypothetical protein